MPFFQSTPDAGTRSQLQALFDFATIGIIVTDDTGHILNFNDTAQLQFGYDRTEVVGKSVEILLPNNIHFKHRIYRKEFYNDPHPHIVSGRDLYAQKKDGTAFPVEVSLSYYMIDGRVCVIAFVIDITIRKNSEAQLLQHKTELEKLTADLKQLNIELEEKVESRTQMLRDTLVELENSKEELSLALQNERALGELKSRFVTMASHEFRTPLSTILSSAYLAKQYSEQGNIGKANKHLDRIKESVTDMKDLLENFLSLGKLEEGFLKASMEWITADNLIDDLTHTLLQLEEMKKPDQKIVSSNLLVPADKKIYLDRQLLKNTLTNLITNAMKFSPERSTITIESKLDKDNFQITVADQGMGISEEDRQHLFRRFFRSKSAANIPGTGLGLHIVGKYIELMQGTISCQSVPEHGTIFTVCIPQPNP